MKVTYASVRNLIRSYSWSIFYCLSPVFERKLLNIHHLLPITLHNIRVCQALVNIELLLPRRFQVRNLFGRGTRGRISKATRERNGVFLTQVAVLELVNALAGIVGEFIELFLQSRNLQSPVDKPLVEV